MSKTARTTTKLPTIALDDLRVASPCDVSWDGMAGTDRVRACGSCQKNVFNLSNMTRDEAQALLLETEGRVCVRFYRRRDGTVITQDCPVGLARVRRRLALIGAGVAAALGLVAAVFGLRREPPLTRLQGEVSVPSHEQPLMGKPMQAPVDLPEPDAEVRMGEIYCPPDVAPVDSTG